jgi:predicted O-methyltransferase YrrM
MTEKKHWVEKFMNMFPYVRALQNENLRLHKENSQFKEISCFPYGHYYSPIVSVEDLKKREKEIWGKWKTDGISGIDLNADQQINLLNELFAYYQEMPFQPEKQPNIRYYLDNDFYNYTDGIVLYSMIRHFQPKRIIEIGSGFSSAVMLDTNQLFFNNEIRLTFMEPYPERLHSLMNDTDLKTTKVIQDDVQVVPLEIFAALKQGDILFIDSTHVVKTGSDVNYILFEILPVLQRGVLIHFHDIFYPFEYPKKWVYGGRNWNEDYFLRAFLMHNNQYEIRLFSAYLHKHHSDVFIKMPWCKNNPGFSLWLEKK